QRARAIGADRTVETGPPVPSSLARALRDAQREEATETSAGAHVEATARTPSEEAPGGDATRPEGAAAAALPIAPAMTPDGRLALSTKGNTIKVWALRTGQAVHTFQGTAAVVPSRTDVGGGAPAPRPAPARAKQSGRPRTWAMITGAAIVVGAAILAAI